MTMKSTTAIIVAAGSGTRMGGKDKPYLTLLDKPMLAYSLLVFDKVDCVSDIVIAVKEKNIDITSEIVGEYNISKPVRVVPGGKERQDSVFNALVETADSDYVLIHDAARPLVEESLVERVLSAAARHGGAVPAVRPRDTVKYGREFVGDAIDRDAVRLLQTPQGFRYSLIRKAYELAYEQGVAGTDDSSLVGHIGHPVKIVESTDDNFKITYPSDIVIAEALLAKRMAQ